MYLIHILLILFIKTHKKFLSFTFSIIYNASKKKLSYLKEDKKLAKERKLEIKNDISKEGISGLFKNE